MPSMLSRKLIAFIIPTIHRIEIACPAIGPIQRCGIDAALQEEPGGERLQHQLGRRTEPHAVVDQPHPDRDQRARHPPQRGLRQAHVERPEAEVRAERGAERDRDAAEQRGRRDVELPRFGVVEVAGRPGEARDRGRGHEDGGEAGGPGGDGGPGRRREGSVGGHENRTLARAATKGANRNAARRGAGRRQGGTCGLRQRA